MVIKNGFLLIELMIGLTLSTFLILIITHYIIEVKNVQQLALARVEALSLARNTLEKFIAHSTFSIPEQINTNQFTVNITNKSYSVPLNTIHEKFTVSLIMKNIVVTWVMQEKKQSVSIDGYSFIQEKNEV